MEYEEINDLSFQSKINLVNCLLKFTFNEDLDVAINEEEDILKYKPDGISVAYAVNNYGEFYHPDYEYLSDIEKKKQKELKKISNKGRKPKQKVTKAIKTNKINKKFASSITFGIIDPNDRTIVYSVKLFQKTSINISSLKTCDITFIQGIVKILIDYINNIDPNIQIKLDKEFINITLCNINDNIILPESDSPNYVWAFNIFILRKIIQKDYPKEYWGADRIIFGSSDSSYLIFHLFYGEKSFVIKFLPNGKLPMFCSGDKGILIDIINKFRYIIFNNYDKICMKSIPTRKKNQII